MGDCEAYDDYVYIQCEICLAYPDCPMRPWSDASMDAEFDERETDLNSGQDEHRREDD